MFSGLALAAALAMTGAAAHAQPWGGGGPGWGSGGPGWGGGGPGMMGYGGGMHHGMMRGGPRGFGPGAGAPAFNVDARLAALKTELKISSNQESAWNAYAAQVKKQSEAMQALFAKAPAQAQSAPERMAQRAEFAKVRATNMEAMSGVVKGLYATLTAEQKTLADQFLAGGGRGAGRFGGGRGPWR